MITVELKNNMTSQFFASKNQLTLRVLSDVASFNSVEKDRLDDIFRIPTIIN